MSAWRSGAAAGRGSGHGRRDPELERLWRRRVREQARLRLSVREFCDFHDLPESSFYFWRREIARRDAASGADRQGRPAARRRRDAGARQVAATDANASPRFVPLVISDGAAGELPSPLPVAAGSLPPIELVHPCGVTLRVPAGTKAAWLAMVLDVLEGRRC